MKRTHPSLAPGSTSGCRRLLALAALICHAGLAAAQAPSPPRITHIHPLGALRGGSFEIDVVGLSLDRCETLHFSFPGAKAEPVGAPERIDPKTPPKGKGGMAGPPGNARQKFKVTLPAGTPLGIHDLRVVTAAGISNPRAFVVSDQPELAEKESNDDVPQAQKIAPNSSVSGVISTPTDVDYVSFTGKKGQRIVVSCQTTSVDSRLPAYVQLYSASGSYLAFSRAYWNNDAVLDATLPADGDYFVRVSSFAYTVGGADYFYRLNVTTAPWIDAVEPMSVEPGKETKVTVWGRNLPGGVIDPTAQVDGRPLEKVTATVKAPADPSMLASLAYSGAVLPLAAHLDGLELRVKNDAGHSNPFLLLYAACPPVVENRDNDTLEKAQAIPFPCDLTGRLEKRGDRDWFRFEAKKGETIAIELYGERLGAPADLFFQVRDAKGGSAHPEQDENPETTSNLFYTRSDDPPRYRFTAPADGDYLLMISGKDVMSSAGPRQGYLARLSRNEGDFHLVAMPSALTPEGATLAQAGHHAYTVFALREGAFTGEIDLTAASLPPGVSMLPQKIAMGQNTGTFVVSAAPEAPPGVAAIKVIGSAVVGGKKATRQVRGATVTWAAPPGVNNVPLVSRLDRELAVAVRGQAPFSIVAEKDSVSALMGEKISIPVKFTPIAADFKTPVNVLALNPPPGLNAQPLTLSLDKKTGTLTLDSKKPAPPGVYTIALRAQTGPVPGKGPPPKGPTPPSVSEVSPPITVTIVPKQLANLSVNTKGPKLTLGKSVELTVSVDRLFGFSGPFKVEALSAKKEIMSAPATIKEGASEVKLVLTASPESKAGAAAPLIIRATAMFGDVAVVHEIKGVSVQITK